MPQFVLLTKLAPESMQDPKARRAMGKDWLGKVKSACPQVRWIAHYALLGPYDFLDIYEAPDVETAQKVALISRSGGATTVESWPALPYDEFMRLFEGLSGS
ncbi:MAG: GYD domain-containing protein [Acidobacteria bacterium]|nr:MAG: GYD domain-containing protein [Acidobacteriota bacterium]